MSAFRTKARRSHCWPIAGTMLLASMGSSSKLHGAEDASLFEPPSVARRLEVLRVFDAPTIDGRLDEPIWRLAAPVSEFVQQEPNQGAAPTYRTEVRFAYDDSALYVAVICEQPEGSYRVQNLKRDFDLEQNDRVGIAIDGFLDQRNAAVFEVTPEGNQRDLEVLDGTRENQDWNARWTVRTQITDEGWQAEFAIPWRNLRYSPGTDTIGAIVSRTVRDLNEQVSFPPVPRALSTYRMAYAAELSGIEAPRPSRNVVLNPYLVANQQERSGEPSNSDHALGGELKWAISQGTVLDVTANTDFAQAEVDRQVVNLERFDVFFPERRQFFLESANLFDTGVTNWIQPFFSRRIGLDDSGRPIPIEAGGRLTRRTSNYELAALAMRQESLGDSPAADFAVARYARNLAGQSRIGGMLTYRRDAALHGTSASQANTNTTATIDGTWRPNQRFGVEAMLSHSQDDANGDGLGGQFWAGYENNSFYIGLLEYFNDGYDPGVGLEILDTDYIMHSPGLSFDLRPSFLPDAVRSFNPYFEAYVFRTADNDEFLFAYAPLSPFRLEFQNGGEFSVTVEPNRQNLSQSFFPAGVEIAPGEYDYVRYRLDGSTDPSARVSFAGGFETGRYFDGELTTYEASARFAPSSRFAIGLDAELNRLSNLGAQQVNRKTRLYGIDFSYAWSPRLQFDVFAQRVSVSERTTWNARLAWEYQPLSFLYIVYGGDHDDHDLAPMSRLRNEGEQLIVKFSHRFEL